MFGFVAAPETPREDVAPAAPPVTAPPLTLVSEETEVAAPPQIVVYERNLRAKHYRLTLRKDGIAVATIPARGSERAARKFVAEHTDWLKRVRERQRKRPRQAEVWSVGTELLWRGEMLPIRRAAEGPPAQVSLGADLFRVPRFEGNLRPTLEAGFLRKAKIELPARTWELAAVTRMDVKRVAVRNQRSRWGSCTEGGVISLNWRLILTPPWVSDYVIYHELMHLREMNHSKRFWAAVAEVCPRWEEAEVWLKKHGSFLGL
ncbi:M48 family metallopeptidase [Actomonas aquatica]|uniref:SprT family zinc-dependent metalloprotease n=1 Tax=Actomonas aquatica TaxID=2866162 RepID=A0ABZ1C4R2_9BACT|nr:SprT family zinc-dependent metalloprotease [Opitutus sp. WL0086]WRQ86372.1 SprT family zinc-dependent metalloprotease [Opitutus sp. WL0086]